MNSALQGAMGKAGKSLFEKHLQQYAPEDPLYETYTDSKGRQKRRKREIPPGLSKRDAKILKSVNRRAHYLDKGFHLCGMRFGWTFIIGVIPGAGDIADAGLNYFLVVRKARKADLPQWLINRMLMNNAASAMMGLVPFAGDVALAAFKANSRNAALLSEFLRIRGEEYLKLKAAGKSPESIGKAAGKDVVGGVPKSDAQQVKPGAGAEHGEIIPLPEGFNSKSIRKTIKKFLGGDDEEVVAQKVIAPEETTIAAAAAGPSSRLEDKKRHDV